MPTDRDTKRVRVEYFYDPESHNWGFSFPDHHIIGGARTRKKAEQEAAEAFLFWLECDDQEDFPVHADVAEALAAAETEIGYLEVTVRPVPAAPGDAVRGAAARRRRATLKEQG